jgi:hypothetical protein
MFKGEVIADLVWAIAGSIIGPFAISALLSLAIIFFMFNSCLTIGSFLFILFCFLPISNKRLLGFGFI